MRDERCKRGKRVEEGVDVVMIYMRQAFIWPRSKERRGKGVEEGVDVDMKQYQNSVLSVKILHQVLF